MTDLWIVWTGGECPVDGDTLVDVIFSHNAKYYGAYAKQIEWNRGNVIAYRLSAEESK